MSKLKFDPTTPLYLSDASAWKISQLSEVLTKLEATKKRTVIFVHGRGKEPEKGLRGATFTKGMAVHKIEQGYGVNVLMFNWDSAFHGWSFLDREVPLSHTQAGAEAFVELLVELLKYEDAHKDFQKPSLLVHSMGSVVLQKATGDKRWPTDRSLFSNILLSEPDADDVGHASWLSTLAEREKVYVTMNKDDHVLRRSTDARPAGAHALGLGTDQPLAAKAFYVDLSNMGALGEKDEDHEVFGKGAMNGQALVCQFFTEALLGEAVKLNVGQNVESVERNVIYHLKGQHNPSAPCLKVPTLPGD